MTHASPETENESQTIAWIFYSVAMASGSAPAPLTDISTAADAINHAVPTHKEMFGSMRKLQELGLVVAHGKFFNLTDAGGAVIADAQGSAATVSKVWKNLTLALKRLSAGRLDKNQ